MIVTGAVVLFAVTWFLTLFIALTLGVRTQAEAGRIEPGTPASAPVEPMMRRRFFWVTVITLAIWLPLCALILWGGLTIRDIDVWHLMPPVD